MQRIRRKHPELKYFWIPRKFGAKDTSDFIKKYGVEKTKEYVKEFIKFYGEK